MRPSSPICFPCKPPASATSATTHTPKNTTPISGPLNTPSSTNPAKQTSRAICLRLPHQRGRLPQMAGMDAKNLAPALVLWGKYDLSFDPSEPEAYRRDVPKAEVHVLEAGHFTLDTAADEIADLVRGFMASKQ